MKPTRALTRLFAVLAVLIATSMAGPASTARAGWNGQQIAVVPQGGNIAISGFSITGLNQNNSPITYNSPSFGIPGTTNTVSVYNTWWKGTVTISIYASVLSPGQSRHITCNINVPNIQTNSDWVNVGLSTNSNTCYRI